MSIIEAQFYSFLALKFFKKLTNKIFKLFKPLKEQYIILIIYNVSRHDLFYIYFTSNINDWNYNKMIKTPDVDPVNPNKKLNDEDFNLYK